MSHLGDSSAVGTFIGIVITLYELLTIRHRMDELAAVLRGCLQSLNLPFCGFLLHETSNRLAMVAAIVGCNR